MANIDFDFDKRDSHTVNLKYESEKVSPALNETAPESTPSSLTALLWQEFWCSMTSKNFANEPLEQRVTRVCMSKDLKQILPRLFPHFESKLLHIL